MRPHFSLIISVWHYNSVSVFLRTER